MLKIKNRKESDINFNFQEEKKEDSSLQRTDEWFKKRSGCWTGSKIKNVMACNTKGGKLSWSDSDKIYEFSKGVIKYVYSRAMERKTERYIQSGSGAAMDYGTKVEPYILSIGEKIIGQKVNEVDFKQHNEIETLGASSDGITEDKKMVVEIKACVTWETHYDRTFEKVNEKSTDFWQTQIEMIVWNVDKCAYLIAQPPNNIFDYLNDKKGFDDFKKECDVSVEIIEASKFHQTAILKRVEIIEAACQNWIDNGGDLAVIFWDTVDAYKKRSSVTGVSPIEGAIEKAKEITKNEKHLEHVRTIKKPKTNLEDLPF